MKAIIKYISLLLCSGLIIPFYYYHNPNDSLHLRKNIKKSVRQYQTVKKRYSAVNEIAATLFPIIKKLK